MIGTNESPSTLDTASPKGHGGVVMGDVERSKGTPDELKDTALSRERVEQYFFEVREQPAWRREADRCCDYYDNNQLDAETLAKLEDRGQPPLIDNLIKPTIDTVLGMEAKSRTDWRVRPEDDDVANDDTAEALSVKLKHAETESRADRACSDGYASQCKAGMGWVEVARERDPLKYRYRVRAIHRREISWDWRSKEPDLSDARYLIRNRWMEVDEAIAVMPQYAELFRNTVSGWAGWEPMLEQDTGLHQSFENERDSRLDQNDWRDCDRQRVCLSEVWYRKPVRGYVMSTPGGQAIEVDFDNPRHVAVIRAGLVEVKAAIFSKIRLAWYCGPHFLYDIPSPYKHGHYPYVPFFGFREDQTNAPYGLIRTMLSPQDEVNARKSKLLWALNSRRVIADSDVVKDHKKAAEEVSRSDAYIILEAARKPGSQFQVLPNNDVAAEQFQALLEAKSSISEVSGIHKTLQGQQTGAKSGLAINSLVEQGLNTLGELNDNFRFSRRMVGEMLFSLIQEDLAGKPTRVTIGKGKSKRIIVLNMPVVDEQTGQVRIENDVSRVRAKVVLDDVPSSPTFRMQQQQMLTSVLQALPPDIAGAIADFVVEGFDLPNSQAIAERVRKQMNLPDDSPEAQQAQAQAAQEQQMIQRQMIALEMQERQAKIQQMQAKAAKDMADAQAAGADDGQLAVMQAEFQRIVDQQQNEIEALKLRLLDRQSEQRLKAQVTLEQEAMRNATALQQSRIASATSVETAMIAHPAVDLNSIMTAVQALTQQVASLTTKPVTPKE